MRARDESTSVAAFQTERPSFFERSMSLSKGFVVKLKIAEESAVAAAAPPAPLPPLPVVALDILVRDDLFNNESMKYR